jgi:hypothetical protein
MSGFDEERIGQLLHVLPPAPAGWVAAAQELPQARLELSGVVTRARRDAQFRARLLADVESVLAAEGLEPRPTLVELVRRHVAG